MEIDFQKPLVEKRSAFTQLNQESVSGLNHLKLFAQMNLVLAQRDVWLCFHPETEDKHLHIDNLVYNTSDEACAPFGFYYGDYVSIPSSETINKRTHAWVLGVFQDNLYFDLDGAPYFSTGYKKEDFSKTRFYTIVHYVRDEVTLAPPVSRSEYERTFSTVSKYVHHRLTYHASNLLRLLNDPEKSFSDVTFLVKNEAIPAHKNILCARSQYFSVMFQNGMQESSQKEIKIEMDIGAPLFRGMLEYLYTGDLDFDKYDFVQYLIAAQMFQIEDLAKSCYQYLDMTNQITDANVIHLLISSDKHQLVGLRELCLRFIWDHYDSFTEEQRMSMITDLQASTLSEILGELQPRMPDLKNNTPLLILKEKEKEKEKEKGKKKKSTAVVRKRSRKE